MTDAIKPPSEVVAAIFSAIDRAAEYWAGTMGGLPTGEDVSEWLSNTLKPELEEWAEKAALTANAPVGSGVWAKLQALWIALDGGPQPRCRDCADHDGNCPNDVNLPCDPQERALEQIKRLRVRSAAPVGEPVAWMMPEHIKAYRLGEEDGIAWANREKTESYTVPLYTHQPVAVGADEIATAKKALEFYADPNNWIDTPSWDADDPLCMTPNAIPVKQEDGRPCDCGDTARAAIILLSGEKK